MRMRDIIQRLLIVSLVIIGFMPGCIETVIAAENSTFVEKTKAKEENSASENVGEKNTESPEEEVEEEADGEKEEDEPKAEPLDMTKVTLEKKEFKSIRFGEVEKQTKEFDVKIISEVELVEGENVKVKIESSNDEMSFDYSLEDNVLKLLTNNIGETTLFVSLNEKIFLIKIEITVVTFEENSLIMALGEKYKIKIKGGKNLKIKWSSSKPGTVSVNKKGELKAKKEGNAIITAELNGERMGLVVSSIPSVKKDIVNWTEDYLVVSQYSQPKRMKEGFFDCSSLVWRAYDRFGYKLGGGVYYAPTAAGLCKYYETKGKKQLIKGGASYENIEKLKFLPGDLMFAGGADNGRHRGIYHVEMVKNYSFHGWDEDGKPVVGLNFFRLNEVSEDLPAVRPYVNK